MTPLARTNIVTVRRTPAADASEVRLHLQTAARVDLYCFDQEGADRIAQYLNPAERARVSFLPAFKAEGSA